MLRAVLKTQQRYGFDGAKTQWHHTIDFECPELEAALQAGGMSETSYELTDLVGVEVIRGPRS